jgi:uncharacterized protein
MPSRRVDMHPDIVKANDLLESHSDSEALRLVQPLASAGLPEALALLGTMYQVGLGVAPDAIKAIELLSRAVEAGVGVAAHNLGTIYAAGMPGVAADHERSRAYYRKAKALGCQTAPDAFYE